jgi:hypothetical protein
MNDFLPFSLIWLKYINFSMGEEVLVPKLKDSNSGLYLKMVWKDAKYCL